MTDLMDRVHKELKIAIYGEILLQWGGGADFLRNILTGLVIKKIEYEAQLSLLVTQKNKHMALNYFNDLFDKGYIELVLLNGNSKEELEKQLKEINADVILPMSKSLGKHFPIPWIGYIPDFQHKYYPQFFELDECLKRDFQFECIASDSNVVMVNSNSVKQDIIKFYPTYNTQIINLPFAPINHSDDFISQGDVSKKYTLPNRYFVISNQFWIHKAHLTAFEALSIINRSSHFHDVEIICTGKTEDYRFPNYFIELQEKVSKLGLQNKIRFLGYVPKEDQIYIMKKSMGVLQPTLFEGGPGGGAVYDAISLGVPCIVSNIPINREITDDNVHFFDAFSSENMAKVMVKILDQGRRIEKSCEELTIQSKSYANKLGESLYSSIQISLRTSSGSKKITITKNAGKVLIIYKNKLNEWKNSRTYQSILAQTYKDFEIVIDERVQYISEFDSFSYVYTISEGYILSENFLEYMLANINHSEAVVCGLNRLGENGKSFYHPYYPCYSLNGETVIQDQILECMLFKKMDNEFSFHKYDKVLTERVSFLYEPLVSTSLLDHIILKLKNYRNHRLYIYGAGTHTIDLLDNIDFSEINIEGIIDKNEELKGKKIKGLSVYHLDRLKHKGEIDKILISSASFEKEIKNELIESFGYSNDKIITLYDFII